MEDEHTSDSQPRQTLPSSLACLPIGEDEVLYTMDWLSPRRLFGLSENGQIMIFDKHALKWELKYKLTSALDYSNYTVLNSHRILCMSRDRCRKLFLMTGKSVKPTGISFRIQNFSIDSRLSLFSLFCIDNQSKDVVLLYKPHTHKILRSFSHEVFSTNELLYASKLAPAHVTFVNAKYLIVIDLKQSRINFDDFRFDYENEKILEVDTIGNQSFIIVDRKNEGLLLLTGTWVKRGDSWKLSEERFQIRHLYESLSLADSPFVVFSRFGRICFNYRKRLGSHR